MNRRAFLSLMAAGLTAELADRLLWVPKPMIVVPAMPIQAVKITTNQKGSALVSVRGPDGVLKTIYTPLHEDEHGWSAVFDTDPFGRPWTNDTVIERSGIVLGQAKTGTVIEMKPYARG